MSTFRKAEIAKKLNDWLFTGRYNAPKTFRGNEKIEREEAEALLGVLLKYTPHGGEADFVATVLDRLEYQLETRTWPSKQEMGAVCVNLRKEAPRGAYAGASAPSVDLRPVSIIAVKMMRGEPVGEEWLWGRNAVELALSGQVDETTMRRYRSGAFFARKEVYGEAAALKWEIEAKERHEAAKSVWYGRKEPSHHRDTSMPDKSAPYSAEAFAAE